MSTSPKAFAKIRPDHFFAAPVEKTRFNWFAFELALEFEYLLSGALRKRLAKEGVAGEALNRACIEAAKGLRPLMLYGVNGGTPPRNFEYLVMKQAFPGVRDKTLRDLADHGLFALDHLLGGCETCHEACITNRKLPSRFFDDPNYYD